MTREEILNLPGDKLIELVHKNFDVSLPGLEDTKYMSSAWEIVEMLVKKGWAIDIRRGPNIIIVDGYNFNNGPGTIFAQYHYLPDFHSTVEGICRAALIALQTTNDLQDL
jgi:hypothetical protein